EHVGGCRGRTRGARRGGGSRPREPLPRRVGPGQRGGVDSEPRVAGRRGCGVGGARASGLAIGAGARAVVSGVCRAGEHGMAPRGAIRAHASGAGAVPRNRLAAAPACAGGCGQSRGGVAGLCGVSRAPREGAGRAAVAGDGGDREGTQGSAVTWRTRVGTSFSSSAPVVVTTTPAPMFTR